MGPPAAMRMLQNRHFQKGYREIEAGIDFDWRYYDRLDCQWDQQDYELGRQFALSGRDLSIFELMVFVEER